MQPSDVTEITAAGAITDPVTFGTTGGPNTAVQGLVQLGGPGRLDMLAGGDVNLGFGSGVTTVANLVDPTLPNNGASITIAPGLTRQPQYVAFLTNIIEPSPAYQSALISYVEGLTGTSGLSGSQADSAFQGLSVDQQRPFIDTVFFDALNQSGLAATQNPTTGYSGGYKAITTLFPGSPAGTTGGNNPYVGSLSLNYSQIYTANGGAISLLVPGGSINVGLANAPADILTKQPSQLGIVAQGSGDIDIYSENSVNVNSSRVFTLGGGNILIWSETGSIDAGNGAKTSLSLPPPTLLVDPTTGLVTLVYDAATAGSGIRTIQSSPDVPAGNVNLVAPEGSVNAGDAGIGAAGNINIAATVVIGASNINFGGTATGVPAAVGGLSASLSGASSAASSTATSASSFSESSSAATKRSCATGAIRPQLARCFCDRSG